MTGVLSRNVEIRLSLDIKPVMAELQTRGGIEDDSKIIFLISQ